jgi:hypothetical protein
MPLALKISGDPTQATRQLKRRLARATPRAAAAGINRAAQGAFTLSVREIQKDVGASSQKTIRRNLSLFKASAEKPRAELRARSTKRERIPIFELGPRPRSVTRRRPAGGVRYGPAQKLIPGSFIARMKSGHVGVFKRLGQARRPIIELFGPSVALVFSRRKITDKIRAYLREKVPQEITRALRFAERSA